MKQIFQLLVCIISRLGPCLSRLGHVPPAQFIIDTTDTLLYLTLLIVSIFDEPSIELKKLYEEDFTLSLQEHISPFSHSLPDLVEKKTRAFNGGAGGLYACLSTYMQTCGGSHVSKKNQLRY